MNNLFTHQVLENGHIRLQALETSSHFDQLQRQELERVYGGEWACVSSGWEARVSDWVRVSP